MSETLNPIEFMKRTAEVSRTKENDKKTQEITRKLVDNSGIFAGQIEEERSQLICQEIFEGLGTKYQPDEKGSMVGGIEATLKNPTASDLQKTIAKENLEILGNAGFRAINFSFRDYPNGLITSALTAEQINDFLPNELKGLGKYIIETDSRLSEDERKTVVSINSKVSSVIDDKNMVVEDVLKQIMEETKEKPDKSLEKQYGQLAVSVILENKNIKVVSKRSGKAVQEEEYPDFVDKKSGGEDDFASKRESATRSWEIDPEHMAQAMKYMAGDLRWSDWTPPEWFKKLEITNPEEAARISIMTMINEAASGVMSAGKNLDKILMNDTVFCFSHEHMSKLFNEDFKLVMSKLLNDLCEIKPDQNGRKCLRYKEGYNNKGIWTIEKEVVDKIRHIKSYEDEMADFLAKKNGRSKPNYMDQMNAYTAWNMFYGFGGSSMADRMRILPTYNGVINDGLRTLNPEYKALGKWQILKSGELRENKDLFDAEYFSGPLADYVLTIMKLERDLDNPIDNDSKKTLRQKIVDGDMPLLPNKTFYSFFDFVHGGRDLFKGEYVEAEKELSGNVESPKNFYNKKTKEGEKVTLSELLMDYGVYENGDFIKNERRDVKEFNFGNDQVTFMNEFRDMLEGAILVYNCTMGKVDVKDSQVWARNLKDKLGMVNGIEINGSRALSYPSNPEIWRDAIIGSFGADMKRLSTNHIRINVEVPKGATAAPAYNLFLNKFITRDLRLTNKDVNLNEIMRLLGVDLKPGESPEGIFTTAKNVTQWLREEERTNTLLNKQANINDRDLLKGRQQIESIVKMLDKIQTKNLKNDAKNIYRDLRIAIGANNVDVVNRLWEEFRKINK